MSEKQEDAGLYQEQMELYYDRPARRWEETLPIGNGSLGGMIWGGVDEELIGLNEESLWSGYRRDKQNPQAFEGLAKVRELVFQGKCFEAEQLIEKTMLGEYNESYMPLGNLHLTYHGMDRGRAAQERAASLWEKVRDYERRLHLEEALVTEDFRVDGVCCHREMFASKPGNAMAIRLTADQAVQDVEIWLESPLKCVFTEEKEGLAFSGKCPEHLDPSYVRRGESAVIWGYRGIRFYGGISVAECDGKVSIGGGRIRITDASVIVLTVWAVRPATLEGKYEDWKRQHIQDYRSIYDKVELYLGPQSGEPTDERLRRLQTGGEDNGLFALYFQYGRYLMISSSRKGSLPANLQGIWSWDFQAPWSGNWTTNINTEMNYWPALSCGLEECLEPYFAFVKKLALFGKKTAWDFYRCRGTVHHHNADVWYAANPVGIAYGAEAGQPGSVCWSMWPMGMAWLAQEFYAYYEYTEDREFLEKQAYPLFRDVAWFLVDWLVPYQGSYVTCPSTSPENKFRDEEGRACAVTMASAMDMELTREVFEHYLDICRILEMEEDPWSREQGGQDLIKEVRQRLAHLAPVRVGSRGQILEWFREYEEAEPGHRHLSHLYGYFPSELWAGDQEMEKAVRISLDSRLKNGGGHTGWSCAWIINLMAVLGDGEGAWKYLHTLLTRSTYPNLWDAHEPFQIDGNFGGIAGIANMLVQDRGGELKLLPALPKQFSEGYVRGLRIKGNREVSLTWKEGKLAASEIRPLSKEGTIL